MLRPIRRRANNTTSPPPISNHLTPASRHAIPPQAGSCAWSKTSPTANHATPHERHPPNPPKQPLILQPARRILPTQPAPSHSATGVPPCATGNADPPPCWPWPTSPHTPGPPRTHAAAHRPRAPDRPLPAAAPPSERPPAYSPESPSPRAVERQPCRRRHHPSPAQPATLPRHSRHALPRRLRERAPTARHRRPRPLPDPRAPGRPVHRRRFPSLAGPAIASKGPPAAARPSCGPSPRDPLARRAHPRRRAPGDYTATLRVTAANAADAELPITLSVWDFTCPRQF